MATTFTANQLASGTSTLTQRTTALAASVDLVQAGAVFNDATRLLDGGLWSKPADAHNQANYLGMYTADITAVQTDIANMLANPTTITANGVTVNLTTADLSVLSTVEGQLATLLTDAQNSVGNSAAATAAQNDIHTLQTSITGEIQGNTDIATALANVSYMTSTGATNIGFQASPVGHDTAVDLAAATTPGATLAQIGVVFNAAADLAIGGVNSSNLTEINTDLHAVATGIANILNSPTQLAAIESGETAAAAALTTIHLQTVENEVNLQLDTVNPLYTSDANKAARETNDNLLDIIDIVQNDTALNAQVTGNAAGTTPSTTSGFGEQPSYLTGTITHYQDNAAQTTFWQNFIASANTLGAQTITVAQDVANHTANSAAEATTLIAEINAYEVSGSTFDSEQGHIFGARFDNELLNGTLQADSSAAIQAIQSGNVSQATAAANGFIADAADVSGINIPVNGGTYNSQVLATAVNGSLANVNATVAGALSTTGTTAATTTATTTAATTTATTSATTTATTATTTAATDSTTTAAGDNGHHHHHFGHMWG